MRRATGIDALAAAAAGLVPERGRTVLGIAGAPGAGKSTLVEALLAQLAEEHGAGWVAHVPMDGFHLADVQLERLGALSRKGAPDTFDAAGYAALLRRVRAETGHDVYAPGFERELEQPVAAALVVEPSVRLVVTEGNYLLLPRREWRAARAQLGEVWFVETDDHLRRERLVERHVRFGKPHAAAAEWVASTDEANAVLVTSMGDRPDRVVLNAPGGWRFAD